ncbi:MAG: hypothetical protein HQ523_14875 [Lentisphaerae bacterium]|nr:hypothetical protein [Lentisphaerota bacterium]
MQTMIGLPVIKQEQQSGEAMGTPKKQLASPPPHPLPLRAFVQKALAAC